MFFLFIVAITLFQFGLTWLLNRFILFLPLSWVLVEILRLYFHYGGFPFDYLGLVFSYIPYAQNLLAFIGIFGGSFLILLFNFLIYKIFENPFWDKERKLYITALSLLSIVLISTGYWLEKKIEFSYKNLEIQNGGMATSEFYRLISTNMEKEEKDKFKKYLYYTFFITASVNIFFNGGRTGIRTLGTVRYNGFQDRRIRPLCHFS